MKNLAEAGRKILVAPLDWGLGHATRCIPIIKELMNKGHEVVLAGDGKVKALLQQEFPGLLFLTLKGYEVRYAKTKWGLPGVLFLQVPRILKAIRYEQNWLSEVMQKHRFDMVISDNRFGLHHPGIHSVFITHQLLIKAPFLLVERFLQRINYHYINQFDECWVPDHELAPTLAGELAHPQVMPQVQVKYIGPQSRFHFRPSISADQHLLVLLSGPEPQRSVLEQKILEQLKDIHEAVLLIRGLPDEQGVPGAAPNIVIRNHLPAQQLEEALVNASVVVGRCGYSTVMDVMALKKKSILIPTPGQTEQEYLARHLMKQGLALCIEQEKFDLKAALPLVASFPYPCGFLG